MIAKTLLAATTLVACAYDTRFEDCTVQCSGSSGCPADLICGPEGMCRASGTEVCGFIPGVSPSCAGLAPTCGPNGDEDCCSIGEPIPGGTFFRSYDVASDGMYPSMSYPAAVSPFVLDRFEVTVGRFRKFVEAGKGTRTDPPPSGAGTRRLNGVDGQGGWDTSWNTALAADSTDLITSLKCNAYASWTDTPGGNEERPINCITWYDAFAFCAWDGGFLPTEAEWNFTAAGGDEQRAYPWSVPPGTTSIGCSFANYDPACSDAVERVGTESPNGDGRWKQADLAGNVWEWTLDWYQNTYAIPCENCAELGSTTQRGRRGGGFFGGSFRTGAHTGFDPARRVGDLGARCARAP